MKRYFHFSLGPVQSFVAQARRTRDYWAGSFLLSYLSAVAMAEVEAQSSQNEVIFPRPDAKALDFLRGRQKAGKGFESESGPEQMSVPNRFKAEVDGEFSPEKVRAAVRRAWYGIADRVWFELPPDVRRHEPTREVWHRQIGSREDQLDPFWRVQWVLVDEAADAQALDRRKNLRPGTSDPEPGVKCMLMDGFQELSGAERPGREVGKFWTDLKRSSTHIPDGDLREGEQLCAYALVKRLFPRVFDGIRLAMPSGWTAHGWSLKVAVPSVSYMAAAPWLARLIQHAPEREQLAFTTAADRLGSVRGEWRTELRRVTEAAKAASVDYLSRYDGDLFYDTRLANPNEFPDRDKAEAIRRALANLCKAAGRQADAELGEPSPFYAVVAMDGDRLGAQMSKEKLQAPITEALEAFTAKVPEVVKAHSGFLIYAGGDDVSALFPATDALPAALALRRLYLECFVRQDPWPPDTPTLSGAVVFPHIRLPLGRALEAAQDLLKRSAKRDCGRDAIAAQVVARGGERLTWALPWETALETLDEGDPAELDALKSKVDYLEMLKG